MAAGAAAVAAVMTGLEAVVDLRTQAEGSEVRPPRTVLKVFLVVAVAVVDLRCMRRIYFPGDCPHLGRSVRRMVFRRENRLGTVVDRRRWTRSEAIVVLEVNLVVVFAKPVGS